MPLEVGERIRLARKYKNVSQIEAASAAGIAVNSLRLYEAGKRTPNIQQLRHIADALGVNVLYLIGASSEIEEEDDVPAKHGISFDLNNPDMPQKVQEWLRGSKQPLVPEESVLERILSALAKLNATGQEKVLDYAEDLAKIAKYQQNDESVAQAHADALDDGRRTRAAIQGEKAE